MTDENSETTKARPRILAICGSLRAASTNKTVLQAWALLAKDSFQVHLYQELERVPPFNPDLESAALAGEVGRLRALVRGSAAVLFSTPEYAHGIPGTLKNALDWLVGSGEFSKKPVALINASPRGVFAQASLKEILVTMDGIYLSETECTIPLLGQKLAASEVADELNFRALLVRSVSALHEQLKRA